MSQDEESNQRYLVRNRNQDSLLKEGDVRIFAVIEGPTDATHITPCNRSYPKLHWGWGKVIKGLL